MTDAQTSTPIVSLKPLVIPAPERGDDLQVRVSAPATGQDLPIVVFSHGFGWSLDGYAPLADYWASHGFVVIQPTHLDSRTLDIAHEDPRFPDIWRYRVEDLTRIIDELDAIEAALPGLAGRLDRSRIAIAGHSWGAQSASMLLGARVLDPDGNPGQDYTDARVKAGVLLALTGAGGDHLADFARNLPFLNPDLDGLTAPALFVAGDHDQSALSSRGPEWFTEAYHLSPAPKSLLTLAGAEHSLGGIPGYTVTETTDESPERVALLQQLTTAYLRSALDSADTAWNEAVTALADTADPIGAIESK